MQDSPGVQTNFFFASDMGFFLDWQNFINLIDTYYLKKESFNFDIIPYKSLVHGKRVDDEKSYSFPFDFQLFESYDLNPVKVYKNQKYGFCDVFMGDYFMLK